MNYKDIKNIACIGAGLIGTGWAINFLIKGYNVKVYDIDEKLLNNAKENIEATIKYLATKGLSINRLEDLINRVVFTSDIKFALTGIEFIQESGPESYSIKKRILMDVDKYASSDAIFASSTSGLLISEIAKESKHPERCIGAHPYNPVYLIPLVEISKGDKTREEVIDTAYSFYKLLGKEPIVLQKEALGFIANRLQVALYREAVDLVYRGVCSIEDVDKAVCFGPGMRYAIMGPNLLYHLGGGAYGIRGILTHIGPSVEMWWNDMADWKKWPEGWANIANEGVDIAIKNRESSQGNDIESLKTFRDDMIIELIKLHKKI